MTLRVDISTKDFDKEKIISMKNRERNFLWM